MPTYAIVLPRYLPDMIGGAETLLQGYAMRLVERGYTVEILTTTCYEIFPPTHALTEGLEILDGVRVRRFRPDPVDIPLYWSLHQRLFERGEPLSYSEQHLLLANQINSSALCAYLEANRDTYAGVLIAPFPFGLTIRAAAAAGAAKAIWVPCLHDEAMAYWPVVRESLEGARGIIFNTAAEEQFAREVLGLVNPLVAVVGAGVPDDVPQGDGARFRQRHDLHEPFILYAGRIVPQKNVPLLIELVQRYRHEVDSRLRLVLVGSYGLESCADPGVYYAGELSRAELTDAYAAADVFCQPSLNESFSIVMMEAWQQHCPVLVHGECAVTRSHIEHSAGGWSFTDFESFKHVLDVVLLHPEQAAHAGERGFAYVQREYRWSIVMEKLEVALNRIVAPLPLVAEIRQRGIRHALAFSQEHYAARFDELMYEVGARTQPLALEQRMQTLHDHATLGMPDYHIRSGLPKLGPLIAWVRHNSTSHLKEPYLDPIVEQQTAFNHHLIDSLQTIIEYNIQQQSQLECRIRNLEAILTTFNHQQSSSEE